MHSKVHLEWVDQALPFNHLLTRSLTREDQSTLSIGVIDFDGFTIHCVDSKTQHEASQSMIIVRKETALTYRLAYSHLGLASFRKEGQA